MNAASLLDTCETTVELAAAVRLLDKRRDSLADDAFASMGASLLSLVERLLGQQLGVFLAAQTSRQQKQENMRLIFAALRELQLVAPGARSQDVAEGRPAQTLNFLWELVVRIQLLRLAEVREATSGATTNAEQPTSPSPTLSPSTLHLALNRPTPTPPPARYGSGSCTGYLSNDVLTWGGIELEGQTFSQITNASGMGVAFVVGKFDGILGLVSWGDRPSRMGTGCHGYHHHGHHRHGHRRRSAPR